MTDTARNYYALTEEASWIDYLRTRLPYAFNRMQADRRSKQYILTEPMLLEGQFAAERHNFWRRGNVYYMLGKLLDYFSMSQIGWSYRLSEVTHLLQNSSTTQISWPMDGVAFYNSMQMEKVWGFVQENHLDRERVMLTNLALAVELCLKAVMTHSSFRETNCFRFNAGHDISKLYGELPCSLRREIANESRVFAKEYAGFRREVEADFKAIGLRVRPPDRGPCQQIEADWNRMARRIRESSYTVFLNSNDPGSQLDEEWFLDALNHTKPIKGFKDIIEYCRYAPLEDEDELPIPIVHSLLLLGRFMYEHLFPVPSSGNGPLSGFPFR